MTSNPIDAYIAEHGLLNTIETLLAAPETLNATEAEVATKMRIIAQTLSVPKETKECVAPLMDTLPQLREKTE
ncbi:hypothetical protein PDO_5333 [Rhizobium sp. PDO1-076]|uniref:hypothetical protein n=1 Tax=Rhizobium sp. PDO1-076 TaxID=1125979 RepID=UPI00024E3B47|nr:hypothetical protein [Rhizobium sp. PDO1-076]EHS50694.1 hypothetical protein PDO_5333 [Rhizobium sp. PDO1-076]